MTADIRERLAAEFGHGEVLQFEGRGGKVFDYIEDETVMDRLDEVLGLGRWSVTVEPISVAEGIVKVRLSGWMPDGAEFAFEDFGYQTRDGGESLKEAVSDGIRRCGRYLGIGRYLYRKHDSPAKTNGAARPAPRPAPQRPAPQPVASANPYASDPYPERLADVDAAPASDVCPVHRKPWMRKGQRAWCATKLADGTWCEETPR